MALGPVRPSRHGVECEIFVRAVGMTPVRRQQAVVGDHKESPLAGPLVIHAAELRRGPAGQDALAGADKAPQPFVALPLQAGAFVHGCESYTAGKQKRPRTLARERSF